MLGRFAGLLRGGARPGREAAERIKAWALGSGLLPEGTALTVNEIVCRDPSCPGVETVILIMAPGSPTRAVKIPQALESVTEPDVLERLSQETGDVSLP